MVSTNDELAAALLESRQRWQDLVRISVDLAFETDAAGRFTFLAPATVLGFAAEALIGRPGAVLLADQDGPRFDPFLPGASLRDCRVWLAGADGTQRRMSLSVAPVLDEAGAVMGVRGTARDATDHDRAETAMARALRRADLIDHLRTHQRAEVLAPRMIQRTLAALTAALGVEGAAVLCNAPDGPALLSASIPPPDALLAAAFARLAPAFEAPILVEAPDGIVAALCPVATRFEDCHALLAWRVPPRPGWDAEELALLHAAGSVVRLGLEQGALQREMAREARTDALTGLPNRRAFRENLDRRIARLEQEGMVGTLLFIDLDGLKPVNDKLGHETGDAMLREAAQLLSRSVRPADLVARLGGDEFAIWLDGTDGLAAAERADDLCKAAGPLLSGAAKGHAPGPGARAPGFSIGIAVREPGSLLDGETVLRRADLAMYEAKSSGGAGWFCFRADPLPRPFTEE